MRMMILSRLCNFLRPSFMSCHKPNPRTNVHRQSSWQCPGTSLVPRTFWRIMKFLSNRGVPTRKRREKKKGSMLRYEHDWSATFTIACYDVMFLSRNTTVVPLVSLGLLLGLQKGMWRLLLPAPLGKGLFRHD